MKYGALSTAMGKLTISAQVQADKIEMTWTETGGPPIVPTTNAPGFGSKLVTRSVKDQLNGAMKIEWLREGVVILFTLSLAHLGA
jgi:two-component sensor histidine kinase